MSANSAGFLLGYDVHNPPAGWDRPSEILSPASFHELEIFEHADLILHRDRYSI